MTDASGLSEHRRGRTAMDFDEVVSYIYDIPKFTNKHGLEYTKRLLGWLGHPEKSFRVVHVAGSNGKGSVCAYLNSILRECGYRVGMFTSPHLVDIRERFKIDDEMITKEEFVSDFNDVMQTVKESGEDHPTFFELLFLMSVIRFKKAGAEYAVMETGLGGRLDATNAIETPVLCIITSISLEHTDKLGDTIQKIAAEKAGIIKKNVPVVYDGDDKEAAKVIQSRAGNEGSVAYEITGENIKILKTNAKGIDFSFSSKYYNLDTYVNTPALYQTKNASLAAFGAWLLFGKEAMEAIQNGIENTHWQARMEEIMPGVFIDGAHNPSGIRALMDSVKGMEFSGKPILLFSVVSDKDYDNMAAILTEGRIWEKIIISRIDDKRALDEGIIKAIFRKYGYDTVTFDNTGEAFSYALKMRSKGNALFAAGSLYFAGEILSIVRR